ncbi:MAG TPA: ATP-binding protein [Fimbriimonadales bacterium]|nr:ATP-binding protein [Fimbriimonadales bacterium]
MIRRKETPRYQWLAVLGVALFFFALVWEGLRDITKIVWLVIGALSGILIMLSVVKSLSFRLGEWSRELRATRSELRRTKEEKEAIQRQFEDVIEGLETPLFICDSHGTILNANRAAKEAFAFKEPKGHTLLDVTLSHDILHATTNAGTREKPYKIEINIPAPSDHVYHVLSWVSESEPKRIFIAMTDLTPMRRLEKIRSDFVANASHELRTPMASIRSMAETILDNPDLPQETKERYLQNIISEVDRLTNLADDLLVLSYAESRPIKKSEVNFSELVREVVSKTERQIQEKGLKLFFEAPESLMVEGEAEQLVQVVSNLLSNAVRYTLEGSITVRVYPSDNEVVLEVKDTGIGISSEHLPRIFERFYRVDRARSRETGGTGLGLSIVRHIVESHGGKVEVESELNVGSTFRVRLPMKKPVGAA